MSDRQAPLSDTEYVRIVAGRVRALRRARDLSQQQLAELAGTSRAFVSGFEQGRHSIELRRLRRLATALETTVGALVSGIDKPPMART